MTARQAIVDAIVIRLATLTVANGYQSNAGQVIYSLLPENVPVPSLPCLVVNDSGDAVAVEGNHVNHALRVEVQGFISGTTTTDKACRELIDDIVAAVMGPTDKTLGAKCDTFDVTETGPVQIEQNTERTVGSVTVAFVAMFITTRSNWRVKL